MNRIIGGDSSAGVGYDQDEAPLPCSELDESLSFLPEVNNHDSNDNDEIVKLRQRDIRFDPIQINKLRQDIEEGMYI